MIVVHCSLLRVALPSYQNPPFFHSIIQVKDEYHQKASIKPGNKSGNFWEKAPKPFDKPNMLSHTLPGGDKYPPGYHKPGSEPESKESISVLR